MLVPRAGRVHSRSSHSRINLKARAVKWDSCGALRSDVYVVHCGWLVCLQSLSLFRTRARSSRTKAACTFDKEAFHNPKGYIANQGGGGV